MAGGAARPVASATDETAGPVADDNAEGLVARGGDAAREPAARACQLHVGVLPAWVEPFELEAPAEVSAPHAPRCAARDLWLGPRDHLWRHVVACHCERRLVAVADHPQVVELCGGLSMAFAFVG